MHKDINPYAEADFSWAQWTPNTSLKLCNVTWDASYRDVVRFVSRETQTAYFNSLDGVTCAPGTMHKPTQPVLVEMAFNEASNWNYLVAYNDYPQLETPRRWFYFVQSVEYVNAHTTRLYLMLDVWQSFQFDITIGSSYVVRGHIGVANESQWADYGRTYLALPEGLDTGSEMVTTSQRYHSMVEISEPEVMPGVHYPAWIDYGVIVVSTTSLASDPGDESTPNLDTAGGSIFENMSDGASVYYCTDRWTFINNVMTAGQSYPWVTQGICAVYMVPKIPQDYIDTYGVEITKIFGHDVGGGKIYSFKSATTSEVRYEDYTVAQNFRNLFSIPQRYRNLRKLFTYPYCAIECTCLNGTTIIYKPEDIQGDNFVIRTTYCYAPNGARLNMYPPNYNGAGASQITPMRYNDTDYGLPIDGGEMLESAFGISDLPHFTVVNNGGTLALANSAYTRQYQQQSAGWTYQKALMSANNAMYQSTLQRDLASDLNRFAIGNRNAVNAINTQAANSALSIQQNANTQNNAISNDLLGTNTAIGAVTGLAGAALGGSPVGIVGAGISMAGSIASSGYQTAANNARTNLSNATAAANTANSNSQSAALASQANMYGSQQVGYQNATSRMAADANYNLALSAASGDYENTIAGLNAQVQQMALTPPTSSGALGGDMFNLSNGIVGFLVRFKTCAPSALAAVGEYMLRYGYFVQRFITPPASLMCMTHFTYWQMQECYIRGTLPEQYRLTIKGMFEAGVTVWASADDIGILDWADNDPLPGISY